MTGICVIWTSELCASQQNLGYQKHTQKHGWQ